jgi:hypothetical protein
LPVVAVPQYNSFGRSRNSSLPDLPFLGTRVFLDFVMAETSTTSSRFKAEMPDIPGVTTPPPHRRSPLVTLILGLLALGVVLFVAIRWFSRSGKAVESQRVEPVAQIEVPSPPPDPNSLLPHADQNNPVIAQIADLAKPWSSINFFIRNTVSGENVPATIIRLPVGSATATAGYWAFSRKASYGTCQLEYITDIAKLKNEYDYRRASHPLVGNRCSHTLYDPLLTAGLPGNVWVRGAIVQGADIRPPLGVEIKVQGKQILAIRTE